MTTAQLFSLSRKENCVDNWENRDQSACQPHNELTDRCCDRFEDLLSMPLSPLNSVVSSTIYVVLFSLDRLNASDPSHLWQLFTLPSLLPTLLAMSSEIPWPLAPNNSMTITLLGMLLVGVSLSSVISAFIVRRWCDRRYAQWVQERQQIDAALQHSETKFRRFVESNLIGIYVANFDGVIFEANDAFLEMVGYTLSDLQAGKLNWATMTPSDYAEVDHVALAEQKAKGFCTPFEKAYSRKDGSLVPVLFGCAVFDQTQQRSIGFALDLSDRKRAESASVLASVLGERNRMAREIHDSLAQILTSLTVHLQVAERTVDSDLATAKACLRTSRELAQTGLMEARRSVAALRPQHLEQEGLFKALHRLAQQIFAHSNVNLDFRCSGDPEPLPATVEHQLLRIGQEALMNAFKYADATTIQLGLDYQPGQCRLTIRDNGRGFVFKPVMDAALIAEPLVVGGANDAPAMGSASAWGGFGLVGMAERAKEIGAQFNLRSAAGEGTEITIVFNQESAYADN
jgi:PAS domain S-box-containing protein